MYENVNSVEDLDQRQTAHYVVDLFHRTIIHHALWYNEVCHQMGQEKALELLKATARISGEMQLRHLAPLLGFDLVEGIPSTLFEMGPEKLQELRVRMAKNWLANDGVWFQSIEFAEGMNEAKRCNDSCWAHFSPFEAEMIRDQLNLGRKPGLDGLKRALAFRVYANINKQSISEETENSFVFQMNACRVQQARNRKGLADYPCKSAGLVEYTYFARTIDARIQTECIGCPPDEHPEEWHCAWRFSMDSERLV
ncbi:DUF6125 family protein [Desulfopila aestuarii]|uniref:Cytosolic protein n=1 Tax=Desulfopila aestuarii DSM 18488 TaxID=1121416 RepID=A0A1M7YAG8_9BACT|nr:DUF6125 family protein [Desulfopila aestuarii]SHO49623.1 hypothetical protein SAMN02745220_02946 [Desulfopila aestuarii DSM 18488]